MAGSVRVNLSVPAEVHAVLVRVAELKGQSVAGVVMSALGDVLPEIRRWVRSQDRQEGVLSGPVVSGVGSDEVGSEAGLKRFGGESRADYRRRVNAERKKGR